MRKKTWKKWLLPALLAAALLTVFAGAEELEPAAQPGEVTEEPELVYFNDPYIDLSHQRYTPFSDEVTLAGEDGVPTDPYEHMKWDLKEAMKAEYESNGGKESQGFHIKNYTNTDLTVDDLAKVYYNTVYDYPEELYFAQTGFSFYSQQYKPGEDVYIKPVYSEGLDGELFLQRMDEAVSECFLPDMTDLEKIVSAHDWLALNCQYDPYVAYGGNYTAGDGTTYTSDELVYTSYGTLINGNAVCQGYALTFKALMDRAGIPCFFVNGQGHAWNIVELDGQWYYVDVTWDDPVNIGSTGDYSGMVQRQNFLKGEENFRASNHQKYAPWSTEYEYQVSTDDYALPHGLAMASDTGVYLIDGRMYLLCDGGAGLGTRLVHLNRYWPGMNFEEGDRIAEFETDYSNIYIGAGAYDPDSNRLYCKNFDKIYELDLEQSPVTVKKLELTGGYNPWTGLRLRDSETVPGRKELCVWYDYAAQDFVLLDAPAEPGGSGTTEPKGYRLTFVYPEELCDLSAYDWYDKNRTPIQSGGILPINEEANRAYGVIEAKNIADGYRIKRFTITGDRTVDMTNGFINGAYGGLATTIKTDTVFTLELEPVPAKLPTIAGVMIYTDPEGYQPAGENLSLKDEGGANIRLYGIASYSDGGNYPVYYTTGQWEYSTDGVTWQETRNWGSNRYDFWPGWSYHEEEVNFLTDSYDLRFCAQPRDLYTTGGNVYSNVLHVNGGADTSSGLTKLATPTDLSWGRDYIHNSTEYEECPGSISWKRETPTQNRYEVVVYRRETGEYVSRSRHRFSATSPYFSVVMFLAGFWPDDYGATPDCNYDSGTYYFTVQALGDGVQYIDSDIAQSPDWKYVKPEAHLATPTNLRWSGRESHWDMPGDISDVLGYSVDYCKYDKQDGMYWSVGGTTYMDPDCMEDLLDDYMIEDFGAGQYYFRVRAISRDITKICNSPWSELSPVYALDETVDDVNGKLDEILGGYRDGGEITEEAQAALKEDLWAQTNTDSLDAAMAADQENTDTVARIEELETLVGGPAEVVVNTGAPEGLVAGDISIIGANLNTEGAVTTTLQVSAPSEGVVIPELYDNTVQFSMKLENVDETVQGQQLKVPVKITMPVPENINPDFLVLLHFHQDGTYEEIMNPYVFEKGGRMFVSFVVTSFSDFAIAQRSMGVFLDDIDPEENTITATVATEMNGTLMAAVYENGKMTGLASAAVAADGQVKQVSLSLPMLTAGAEVKLFLIDGNGMPLYEAASDTVS